MMNVNYRPEIDSLRAASVIAVILFHLEIFNVSGGFLGVDVFFVISGFLISNFITLRLNNNNFSFLEFYTKRTKRLFPALFVVSIFTLFIGFFKFQPESFKFLSLTVSSILLFVSNILFYFEATYFNDLATQSPLLHTWSLSVEEQFYLFWPLVILFVWNFRSRHRGLVLFALGLISFFAMEYVRTKSTSLAFYHFPTRAWELIIGALAALFLHSKREPVSSDITANTMAIFGLLLILFSETLSFVFTDPSGEA